MWVFAAASGSASAISPAEPPPDDFTAAQYIDSAGCVFVRDQTGWVARLARDGQAICGYPPTLSARRTAPDRLTGLHQVPLETRMERITRELVTAVVTGLQTGELEGAAATQSPAIPAPPSDDSAADVSPQAGAAVGQLPHMIAAVPALRQAVSRTAGSSRLCNLLGAAGADAATVGGAAMGACGALEDLSLSETRVLAMRNDDVRGPNQKGSDASVAGRAVSIPAAPDSDSGSGNDDKARKGRAKVEGNAQHAHRANPRPALADAAEPRIPAGARYIQVGIFADDNNAQRAARRLFALGLPVARGRMSVKGKDLQVIMAGPFDGRQALVVALHRTRDGGFKSAYPR